jgi:Bacteriophage Lambda NinG protein
MKRSAFKPLRPRKCRLKTCRKPFVQTDSFQVWCSMPCCRELARINREKANRADYREKKEKQKTRSEWLKEAEHAVNAYVRYRDRHEPCISCQRTDATIWNAGHFKAVGSHPELRYNLDNINKQCARPCNKDLGGNIHKYREGLIRKIGIERVEALGRPHPPAKYTIEDAKRIKAEAKALLKLLKEK